MAQVDRSSGIRVEIPDDITVSEVTVAARRGTRRGGPEPIAGPLPDIAAALSAADFTVADTFELAPAPGQAGRRRRGGGTATGLASISVDVTPGGSAVVLVEEDGYFSWHFPLEEAAGPRPRRRGTRSGPQQLRFELDLGTRAPGARRRGIPVLGGLIGKVTTRVLKFVLPTAIEAVVTHLEGKRHTGLVALTTPDPSTWMVPPQAPAASPGQRTQALLLIHGTFSSTRGGFGDLGVTPWGKELLASASQRYDVVLGYDHKTLSVDPLVNARELLASLRALWPNGDVDFDVVCHSRGGLVYRGLVEKELIQNPWAGTFGRAVFVAAANSGTELANAENWDRLADLYTNLAAMAARGLAIILPGTAVASLVLAEVLDGVGTLVKTIVSQSLVSADIPGLAAMQPGGPFIAALNAPAAAAGPTPDTTSYYAVTSNFKAELRAPDGEISERLLTLIKDGLVTQLMHADNDLVVDLASMTKIDPGAGDFFDERYDFGENGAVYHTNYFSQPDTSRAIRQWFGLDAARTRRGGARPPAPAVPVNATRDFTIVHADHPVDAALLDQLNERATPYIVVDRYPDTRYAIRRDELRAALDSASARGMIGAPIGEVLGLHEGYRSELRRDGQVVASAQAGGPPSTRRTILLSGDTPVGIVASSTDVPTAEQLAELANAAPFGPAGQQQQQRPPPIAANGGGAGTRRRQTRGGGVARNGGVREPRTRRTRGGGGEGTATTGAEPPQTPQPVALNAGAFTDAEIQKDETATLTVSVSRGEILLPGNMATGTAEIAAADPDKPLIIMVIGRKNVRVTGKSTQKMLVPAAGADSTELFFSIAGTDLGPAQVDVIIRQAEAPLAKIVLKPTVVQVVSGGARAEGTVTATAGDDLGPPRHQLYISEQQHGTETSYHFHLDLLKPGQPPEPMEAESAPIVGDKVAYVQSLYKRIEEMWGETRDKVDQFAEQIRAEGATLWDELVPRKIQEQLWANRKTIQDIQVYADEPFIPWELVHMKEPGKKQLPKESLFLAELGLVRWMLAGDDGVGCDRAPRSLRVRRGKVCAVVPEYPHDSGWELESASTELATLESQFGAVQRIPATFAAVRTLLAGGDFDILHYAGHGTGDSSKIGDEALVLSVSRQSGGWLPDTSFRAADVINNAALAETPCAEQRPIVVLNCCETGRSGLSLTSVGGLSAAFVNAGAGVVISPLWSVDDVAAADFSRAFYESLKSGNSLAEAARKARVAIRESGDQTWLAYVVYGEPTARLT